MGKFTELFQKKNKKNQAASDLDKVINNIIDYEETDAMREMVDPGKDTDQGKAAEAGKTSVADEASGTEKVSETDNMTETVRITSDGSFVYGVQELYHLRRSNEVVVTGRMRGTVKPGMKVYVTNFGLDEGESVLTIVRGIEMEENAGDGQGSSQMALKLAAQQESGEPVEIRVGSVIHTRDISAKAVHDAYIAAIGDVYVVRRKLDLTEDELDAMSITDCAEAWRLFSWFHSQQNVEKSEQEQLANRQKVEKLVEALCQKILEADDIYTVYNRATGEPHLFSQVYKQKDGSYMCSHPDILLISKAYADPYKTMYPAEKFEIRRIENGGDRNGIRDFLADAFYLDGACGARICTEQTSVDAGKLVPKPDYGDTPRVEVPVTNPDLMRWLLLIGQMGRPETPDAELVYRLYNRFMIKELTKAVFVIPMKTEGEIPQTDENGQTVLKEGAQMIFPTFSGKDGRNVIRMFTDWRRLREEYDEEWGGLVQPIEGMIERFDCAVNLADHPAAGCYVSREMYAEMKKIKR
ncbi:MAG: SseB family protein [Lachnospiraceae bacterium]|nr:SseB family protein [Lachnospiraceae bacterium]